jgi:hypothetical protein
MEGRIAVAFHHEPSWFDGAVVDGRFRQVVACRDSQSGRIIGFGCRSIRDVYVNGSAASVGYLSSLRLLAEYRNLGLVARGYAFFRRLHQDGLANFYLTTIGEGNATALKVLTSGRAGLPMYHTSGDYHTMAIPLSNRKQKTPARTGLTVQAARRDDLPAVLAFLARCGSRRQFFPVLKVDDFLSPAGALRGLALDWLLLAKRGGELVGTLAGWDQHSYRQSVVHGYQGWLRGAQPIYNVWARLRGLPPLPPPGRSLRYLMVALPVAAEDDPGILTALVKSLRARAAGGPWSHLLLGLHASDPLLQAAQRFQWTSYRTKLFLVSWPDGDAARSALDDRPFYLEAGSL